MIKFKINLSLIETLELPASVKTPEEAIRTLIEKNTEKDFWYAFTLCSGSYPNGIQLDYMIQLSKLKGNKLFNYLESLDFRFPNMDFELAVKGTLIYNVTNTIEFPHMTGIQRFVRNFYDFTRETSFNPISWDFENCTMLKLGDFQRDKIEKWLTINSEKPVGKRDRLNLLLIKIYRNTRRSRVGYLLIYPAFYRILKYIQQKLNPNGKGNFIVIPGGCDYFEIEANADPLILEKIEIMYRLGLLKTNIFCHDILPTTHPNLFPKDPNRDAGTYLKLLQKADLIIVASEELRSELKAYGCYGRIEVVNGMPGASFSEDDSYVSVEIRQRPRIAAVGTLEPRKNHLLILEACQNLWERGEEFELMILGNRGWMCGEIEKKIKKLKSDNHNIVWLENASDFELRECIANSKFTIYIPIAEGWGLPVIEAAALGKHTLASRIPSAIWLEKIYPNLVTIIEDNSISFLEGKILEFLSMSLPTANYPDLGQSDEWYLHLCNLLVEK